MLLTQIEALLKYLYSGLEENQSEREVQINLDIWINWT